MRGQGIVSRCRRHATDSIWSVAYKLVQKISPGKQGTLELSNCGLIQWSHVLDMQPLTMPSPTPEFGQLHPKRKLPICQLLWFALSANFRPVSKVHDLG
jgi:hypothetical protein